MLVPELCNIRVFYLILVLNDVNRSWRATETWQCVTELKFLKRVQERLLVKMQPSCNESINVWGWESSTLFRRYKNSPNPAGLGLKKHELLASVLLILHYSFAGQSLTWSYGWWNSGSWLLIVCVQCISVWNSTSHNGIHPPLSEFYRVIQRDSFPFLKYQRTPFPQLPARSESSTGCGLSRK